MKKRILAVLSSVALAAGVATLTATSAQAIPTCGAATGYSTYVTYGTDALRICQISTPGPYPSGTKVDPTTGYMVFARMGTAGATVAHTYSVSGSGTNPLLNEKTVPGWFDAAPSNTQIVLNGAFFDCTEACATNTSHLSFPLFSGTNSLVTLGNNASADDSNAKRALCFNSAGGTAAYKTWTLNSTNSTQANVAAQQSGCPNLLVGFTPTFANQSVKGPYTYVGIRTSNSTNDTLCFYVGGYQTRAKIQADMTAFGCTPALQLDGGNSSELSVRVNGSRVDLVRSWELPQPAGIGGSQRNVPHAIAIRF